MRETALISFPFLILCIYGIIARSHQLFKVVLSPCFLAFLVPLGSLCFHPMEPKFHFSVPALGDTDMAASLRAGCSASQWLHLMGKSAPCSDVDQ